MRLTRSGSLFLTLLAVATAVPAEPSPGDALQGTSWRLVRIQSTDDMAVVPDDRSKYTIAFGADGGASFRIDCNRGHATWKSEGPSELLFGPLAMTRAMCGPGSLDTRMATDMTSVRSRVLKDGHLFLSLMADGGIYEFEPIPEGPSFDCTKSPGSIEQMICRDADLSALDRRLAAVSAEAAKKAGKPTPAGMRAQPRDGIEKRDDCAEQPDPRGCVEHEYTARIAEIEARSRLVPSTGPFTFQCSDRPSDVILVTFHQTDPPSAVFGRGGRSAFAMVAPSGSGARYEGKDVTFWEKGGEAQVVWFGSEMKCVVRKK